MISHRKPRYESLNPKKYNKISNNKSIKQLKRDHYKKEKKQYVGWRQKPLKSVKLTSTQGVLDK